MTDRTFKKQSSSLHKTLEKTIQVEIVSSEESIFSGRAKMIVVSGEEGEIGILPGHLQLLTSVKPGQVKIISSDGNEEYYYISGGFLEVQPTVVTILADTMLRAADVDMEEARKAKEKAKEMIIAAKKLDAYSTALIELAKATAKLRIAEKWHQSR